MVDSSPMGMFPPSIIMSTLPFKSSHTYFASVGEGLPEILALGAATNPPEASINAIAVG